MYEKIDENLINKVQILEGLQKVRCILWVVDFEVAKSQIIEFFGQDCIEGEFPFLNAIGICVENDALLNLSEFSWVEYVSSVQKANIFLNKSREDLEINDLHKMGVLGQNVCVAVVDTGIYPHLDFVLGKNRIKVFKDFVSNKEFPYDDNGHGTFVAGVVAGSGLVQNGKYRGVAPCCDLAILKALNSDGETQGFTILKAMQWIVDNKNKYNIKVVCMSFGSTPLSKNDPLILGAKALWENGIVVVCAGGNDGPNRSTIKSPGACPNVITVGSADKIKDLSKIKVAPFSSRGPAFDFIKPDIIAPGVEIVSTTNSTNFYTKMTGTSVSTPFVAGMCALMLGQNSTLSPNFVKSLIMASAVSVDDEKNACGSGMLNAGNIFMY